MTTYEYAVQEYQQWATGQISRMTWQVEGLLNIIGRTAEERAEARLRDDIMQAYADLRRERNGRRAEWGDNRRLYIINLMAAIETAHAQA